MQPYNHRKKPPAPRRRKRSIFALRTARCWGGAQGENGELLSSWRRRRLDTAPPVISGEKGPVRLTANDVSPRPQHHATAKVAFLSGMKLEPSLLRSILSRHKGVRPGLGSDAFLLSTPVNQSVSLTVEVGFGHHGACQVHQSLLIPNFELSISREFVHAEVGDAVAATLLDGQDVGRHTTSQLKTSTMTDGTRYTITLIFCAVATPLKKLKIC